MKSSGSSTMARVPSAQTRNMRVEHAAVVKDVQAVLGQRGPGDVLAEPLEPFAVATVDAALRVHADRVDPGHQAIFIGVLAGVLAAARAAGGGSGRVEQAQGGSRVLDPAIMYEAVANREVDVICAFATDGRIAAFELKPLADNRQFFPPYDAAPVVRAEILRNFPEVRDALAPLGSLIDDATMQRLNSRVDVDKRSSREVAEQFLKAKKLIR